MSARTPHDALFKQVFGDPREAAAELRHVLPNEIADAIHWDTLRLRSGEFASLPEQMRADLVFSAETDDGEVLIHVLLEHKSYADGWAPLQLLGYAVRLWEDWKRDRGPECRLPAILSVVVHHGDRPWTGPTSIDELISLTPARLDAFRGALPSFRFFLDDLSVAGNLRSRPVSDATRVVLFALQHARASKDFLIELGAWSDCLRRIESPETLIWLEWYIIVVCGISPERVSLFLAETLDPEMNEIRGGVKEIMAEEIRNAARAELLLLQLDRRFGTPSPEVVERVRRGSDTAIERWATRILEASTIDDVFSD